MRQTALVPKFVDYIPDELQNGSIYVSIPFATAIHKCCCGCGQQVVTPLSPTDWKLIFDGETITLHPSIGNWSFPCQSHYWIERNEVVWARRWSRKEIEEGRAHDRLLKEKFFGTKGTPTTLVVQTRRSPGILHKLKEWLINLFQSASRL